VVVARGTGREVVLRDDHLTSFFRAAAEAGDRFEALFI